MTFFLIRKKFNWFKYSELIYSVIHEFVYYNMFIDKPYLF